MVLRHHRVSGDGKNIPSTWRLAFDGLRQQIDKRLAALIGFTLLLVLASSALVALAPVLLKLIVDRLTRLETVDADSSILLVLIAAYAGSHWLSRSVAEFRSMAVGRVDQRIHRRLSVQLTTHVMALPLRFHLERKTGALSQTLANGLLGYRMVIQHLLNTVLLVVVQIVMIGTVLAVLGQQAFLWIVALTVVLYAVAFTVGVLRVRQPAQAASEGHINANALLTDSILNYETVKSFCAESEIRRQMDNAFANTEKQWARLFARKATNGVAVGTIFALSLGATVFISVQEIQQGRMSVGDLVLVHAYILQIVRPMEMLGFAFRDITEGMTFIEKMTDISRQEPEPAASESGGPLPRGTGELEFDQVSFAYQRERPLLRDVSFRVHSGKTAALVGASGSGKSSLIRLLIRFYEPDSGVITLDGTRIADTSASSLRSAIAVVPQDTVLFNDTIAYNIGVGRPGSSMEEIQEAAQLAHIHEFISTLTDGYESVVGERGLKLSGGEKQRVAIARAVLKKPRIFVFDEATSSLDSKTEQQILQNLREISQGTTTLVVAHRLSTIVDADEILVLHCGRVVERGTHQELLRRRGVYGAMWSAQQDSRHHELGRAIA